MLLFTVIITLMVSEDMFDELVAQAIDNIPEKYARVHENVVFEVSDEPSEEQRITLKLRPHDALFGLFEGVPDVGRSARISGQLPAKITIFRRPMLDMYPDKDSLQKQINQTVWHEVAHYFGLGHEAMHRIQNNKN